MCAPKYTTGLKDRPLTDEELAVCIGIIEKGEAVDLDSVRQELPKATAVAIARLDHRIVGVGAIKRRRPVYASKVSKRGDYSFPTDTLELGYVAVDPAHRGQRLSYPLVAALLVGRNESLFATTSSPQMKKALSRGGFTCQGKEWDGNNSRLSLWLRPAQLSE
jgi:hypothetical protein